MNGKMVVCGLIGLTPAAPLFGAVYTALAVTGALKTSDRSSVVGDSILGLTLLAGYGPVLAIGAVGWEIGKQMTIASRQGVAFWTGGIE